MNVTDYLKKSVDLHPDKIAIKDDRRAMTYSMLDREASAVASGILNKTSGTNHPVAILIERNVESICAFMGVAMTRNFYVPVDAGMPKQRILSILHQMEPMLLIVQGNLADDLKEELWMPVVEYEDLVTAEPDENRLEALRLKALDIDPLYAICTSGSTGTPKGVLVSNRSVLDFIPVFTETFGFSSEDIFGNQAPFDFDVSVKDIYSSLYLGATVVIIPRVCFSMPKKLVETLDQEKVSVIVWAVSAMCIVSAFRAFRHCVPLSLRKVLFSGEVMPIKMLNIWREYLPDVMYVNLYGPTEITCNCLYYIVDRDFEETEKLPLGIPFRNEEVLYLNEENQEIRPGETGEICVKGTCLAIGYYRDPTKTARAFVQNPLNSSYPELIYRTGDLAERRANGEYYFAARKDFQIKHMGHRIELEEIETFLNAADGVTRASCLFDDKKNRIVAFYVGEVEKEQIISHLKNHLPKYMIPNIFIRSENLPLNKNGKIDRQLLREMYQKG